MSEDEEKQQKLIETVLDNTLGIPSKPKKPVPPVEEKLDPKQEKIKIMLNNIMPK